MPIPGVTASPISGKISFIGSLTGGGAGAVFSGPSAVDSDSNIIYATTVTYTAQDIVVAKYSPSGKLLWQTQIDGVGTGTYPHQVQTDSNNNIYIVGYTNSIEGFLVKLNSSGTIQFQRNLSLSTYTVTVNTLVVASTGDIYVGGRYIKSSISDYKPFIAKYNSSGILQWQNAITPSASASNMLIVSIDEDTSGNIVFVATGAYVGKVDTSGTLLSYTHYTIGDYSMRELFLDSSNNRYIAGITVVKLDSSNAISWQRKVSGVTSFLGGGLDSSNNFYGLYISSAGYGLVLVKFNSSGTLQFSRTLDISGASGSTPRLTRTTDKNGVVSSDGFIATSATISGVTPTEWFNTKLLGDGSGTGTYTLNGRSYVYAVGTNTDSAGTIVTGSNTLSTASGTLVDATNGFTQVSGTLTSNITYI